MKALFAGLAAAWLAAVPVVALARDDAPIAIHFPKGADKTVLRGHFKGYDTVSYTLSAQAGQTVSLKITGSTNAYFNLLPPASDLSMSTSSDGQSFTGRLPTTGDYLIEVYQFRSTARRGTAVSYTLTVEVR